MHRGHLTALTHCMLGIFACFLSSANCCCIFVFLRRKFFRNIIRVSNSFDPDQAQHFVEPNLGPNRLQMLSAHDTGR